MKEYKNYSLLHNNTFGINAVADLFVEYETVEELQGFLAAAPKHVPIFHIGGGSNLLFTQDYHGIVLHSRLQAVEVERENDDEVFVRAGAGMVWDDFVAYCIKKGYYGLENLSLIPGEVGASAVQNIGAYGAEAGNFINAVEVVDLNTGHCERKSRQECAYAYRYSRFKSDWRGRYAVTNVEYKLYKYFRPNLNYEPIRKYAEVVGLANLSAHSVREKIISIRKSKLPDPEVLGNAGSFFMNPVVTENEYRRLKDENPQLEIPGYRTENGIKIPAGWLIEQTGWKGRSLGKAGVYDKQALVLVNLGGAKASDIIALSHRICKDVKERFGIIIEPEVNWI